MRTDIFFTLLFLIFSATRCIAAEEVAQPLVPEKLSVPAYPFLARLAGMEGKVAVDVSLNTRCEVTNIAVGKGESRLVDAVERSLHENSWGGLRFRACTLAEETVVHVSYIFALEGKPTNEWSPTMVRVSSEPGASLNIRITTTPADLNELGLGKKKQSGKEQNIKLARGERPSKLPSPVQSEARPSVGSDRETETVLLTDFTFPGYYARAVRVQGDVKAKVELNSNCRVATAKISTGNPLLNEQVLQSIRQWHLSGCSEKKRHLEALFHFSLAEPDNPSALDNWAPTHFEMTRPFEFEIKTTAPGAVVSN